MPLRKHKRKKPERPDFVRDAEGKFRFNTLPRHDPADYRAGEAGKLRFLRMERLAGYAPNLDPRSFSLNALVEGFQRGRYRLPKKVSRYLAQRLAAFSRRPKLAQAIGTLAEIIGRYHCGEDNFVRRGCGIGGEGAGFFLARKALAARWPGLTENLVRTAIKFLIEFGFIERISPEGELVAVRRPKNAVHCTELGYFRTTQKAKKDALGRIRTPVTMYRLAPRTRRLFAKTLRRHETANAALVQEPLWMDTIKNSGGNPAEMTAGIHSGSAPYDIAGHDPDDPRFSRYRIDPEKDPRARPRFSPQAQREAQALLKKLEKGTPAMKGLSPAALAIFNRPVRE